MDDAEKASVYGSAVAFDSTLINLIPTAICVCDALSGEIIHFNHSAEQLWGQRPKITRNKDGYCGFLKAFTLDGARLDRDQTPVAEALRTGKRVTDKEILVERADGSRLKVSVSVDVIRDENNICVGTVSVFQNVMQDHAAQRNDTAHFSQSRDKPFQSLLEHLPVAAYTCDNEGLITDFNKAAVDLWGRTPRLREPSERFCGSHKLFSSDGFPLYHNGSWMAAALQTGRPFNGHELIIERPDGSRTTALSYVTLVYDDAGQQTGAMNLLIDITVRKCLEEETIGLLNHLDYERERLIEVFERSPSFMAILRGPHHLIERANTRYFKLVGRHDIVGKPISDVLPELSDQGYLDILDEVYKTGKSFVGTHKEIFWHRGNDEQTEPSVLDFIYEPLRGGDGSVVGILVHGNDLTEQNRMQQRLVALTDESDRLRRLYETILSSIPDLVYVFGLDHRFTYANQALLDMWGLTWQEAKGKTCLELGYEPWHAQKHDREIEQVIATKQSVRGEVPFLGKNGLRIDDYIFVPVIGADGEVEAVAGTTRDITDRKRMEQELASRAEDLTLADQKKDEFIALLAHELRNPLAPVRNGLRIMEITSNDSATNRQVREMMGRQLGHMVRLIDDLLDVSRMNRSKLHLQKSQVRLTEIIQSALETARPIIDEAGHKLKVDLPPEPIYLDADLTRLAQVFSNLLSNSAKYTRPDGCISLTAKVDGEMLIVSIKDNGIGIPPEALTSIFEMFSQVAHNQELATGGLGIGLALVKTLVRMHDGEVWAESDGPEQGATFTVKLPRLMNVSVHEDCLNPYNVDSSQIKQRILVVDDNHDACESMAMLLKMLGNEVRVAHDGLEAITAADDFRPEIILMDVGMPFLNGYDVTRRIREQPWGKAIIIVAVTGWGQEGDIAQSSAAGCNAHLVKPVNLQELEKLLAELTEKNKLLTKADGEKNTEEAKNNRNNGSNEINEINESNKKK